MRDIVRLLSTAFGLIFLYLVVLMVKIQLSRQVRKLRTMFQNLAPELCRVSESQRTWKSQLDR